jgi:deoxyribodipyrimidine photo-lyase
MAIATPNRSVVVFTRDLRVRDNPALVAACESAEEVVPLFVVDHQVIGLRTASANRAAFLSDSLHDLDRSLRELGGQLVVRRGDWVAQVVDVATGVAAQSIHLAADVSRHSRERVRRLREATAIGVTEHPGVTVVPPGATAPGSGGAWKVFSPFHRRWAEHPWRAVVGVPEKVRVPPGLERGVIPARQELASGPGSPRLVRGGESAGIEWLRRWAQDHLEGYETAHDDLAADRTSRISPYLHFGCLSPLEVATRLRSRPGGGAFVRQLCWRDFHHQVLAARPEVATQDYRPRGDRWRHDPDEFQAWRDGRTGFPVVDAGMRQLREEGFVHNRARMIVASFLTKDLYMDWRLGAAHFMEWLVDGDVANNQLNWQWVAGTGTDSNPHRIFNPTVQGTRFDPTGDYVRRYVPELAAVPTPTIHDPSPQQRRAAGYPEPLVDHRSAVQAYKATLAELRGRHSA